MKRSLFFLFLGMLINNVLGAQENSYEIKITFKPFSNQFIYLGYYYGKQRPITDSVRLDQNGYGVFKGDKKLEGGLYLIGFPDKKNYFEVFIDRQQHFSIIADTADLLHTIKFQGSEDNDLFIRYQLFIAEKGKKIDEAKKNLATAVSGKDSARWTATITENDNEIKAYRTGLAKQHPEATLTLLLNTMKEPKIPPADQQPGGKYDSTFAYQYYKQHYWDDVYFFDGRLVRTPVFEPKLDKYFEQLVYPHPDSVIREIDWMLGYASASPEMQKFLLIKFVNRYLNQKYMWEDKVFVHLFEKYFSGQEYPWLNEQGKKIIFDRAYSLMANLFGNPASDIQLADTSGEVQYLYSVTEPYTVVCFWDPTCGHCKETLPRIDSIYKAKWKFEHVKVFAVAKESEGSKEDWKKFIRDHGLAGWVHVYYSKAEENERVKSGIPGYMQLYDVLSVPTLYLLDKDKRIIAKKIPFDQIDQVLDQKLKAK